MAWHGMAWHHTKSPETQGTKKKAKDTRHDKANGTKKYNKPIWTKGDKDYLNTRAGEQLRAEQTTRHR